MSEKKYPPLIEAVLNDDLKTLFLLISQNVNLEEKDNTGDTALINACYFSHLEIMPSGNY